MVPINYVDALARAHHFFLGLGEYGIARLFRILDLLAMNALMADDGEATGVVVFTENSFRWRDKS